MTKYPPFIGSSIDPDKLALSVKGFLATLIPVLVMISGVFGVTLDIGELNTIGDSIQNIIIAIGTVITGGITLIGLIRKVIVRFTDRA